MQRLLTLSAIFALTFAMLLNIALFVQNKGLRDQAANTAQPAPTQAGPDQSAQLDELRRKLERSEKDRIKATRDATNLRNQVTQLQSAAQERDTLKGQLDTLRQENQQLRDENTNLQSMNTVNGQVMQVRDLRPLRAVERQFMNRTELRAYFTAEMDENFSPEEEQRQRAILVALDMDPGEGDLREAEIDGMVSSILGFYDHTTKQLVVVTNRSQMGLEDKVTYAHEFTHNLQDQHYDLAAMFARAEGNSDYAMAIRALVEGDATLTMWMYVDDYFSDMDKVNYQIEQLQTMDLSGFYAGGPLVESAAAFPYTDGASFAATLHDYGGWQGVTQAFAQPPRSTEQVMHPQKYFDREEPAQVRLPDLGAALGGTWRVVAEDTLGELYLRIYLEYALPIDRAIDAGEGWGGDRYQVLGDDQGRQALALRATWDTVTDAQEFFETYNEFVMAQDANATVLQSNDAFVRWQLDGRQFYVGRVGTQVLALHAPDGATLDALLLQFR